MPLYYWPFLFINFEYWNDFSWAKEVKDYIVLAFIAIWFLNGDYYKIRLRLKGSASFFVFLFIFYGLLIAITVNDTDHLLDVARIYLIYPIWFFLSYTIFTSNQKIFEQSKMFIYIGLFISVIAIYEWLFFGEFNIYSVANGSVRSISTLYNPNALGWYLVCVNAVLLGMVNLNKKSSHKLYHFLSYQPSLIFFSLITFGIACSGSRSAFAANFLVAFLWIVLNLKYYQVRLTVVFLSIVVFVLFLTLPSNLNFLEMRVFSGFETSRWNIYRRFFHAYSTSGPFNIIFGLPTPLYKTINSSGLLDDSFVFTLLASGGLISFVLYFTLVFSSIVRIFYFTRRNNHSQYIFFYIIVASVVLGFLGNFQGIFPLGIIFWLALAFSNRLCGSSYNLK